MKFIDKSLSYFIKFIEIVAISIVDDAYCCRCTTYVYFVFNCFNVDIAYELMGLNGNRALAAALTMFVLSTLIYGATFLNLITDNGVTND